MKTTLALSTLIAAIASSLLIAADESLPPPSIDLPVTRMEVAVALKQYEKVKSLLMDAQLDRELQNAESNIPKDKRAALDTRIEILTRELTKLRAFAEDALKDARETAERERRAAARLDTDNIIDPDPESGDSVPGLLGPPPEPPPGVETDPVAQAAQIAAHAAHIAAFKELVKYRGAKARYLKAKSHLEKLDALFQ